MFENKYTEKDFENLPKGALIKYRTSSDSIIKGRYIGINKSSFLCKVWAYWGGSLEPSWMPVQSIYYIEPQKNLVEVIDPQFEDLYV